MKENNALATEKSSQERKHPKEKSSTAQQPDATSRKDPLRKISIVVLLLALLFFLWYLLSDRFTPTTDLARVHAYVVPIVPQVSGLVTRINVRENEVVKSQQELLQIDPVPYQLEVDAAEAALELAGQDVGAGTAGVSTAQAALGAAQAKLRNAQAQAKRIFPLEEQGVVSKSDGDRTRAALATAEAEAERARADLEKAKQQLGGEGQTNARIKSALAALGKARFDLENTTLHAPGLGGITNLNIDVGQYAQAGVPLMTFVSASDVWVQADMRENSIGNIKPGDSAEILLDVAPGQIFKGEVASIGYGVKLRSSVAPGQLASVQSATGWLRDSQRFPVIIRFSDDSAKGLRRAGGQADVIVYTGDSAVLNGIGRLWIRLLSVLSYVY
jgi:multidrug resistance efflux pump